jgi:hypothetical protein
MFARLISGRYAQTTNDRPYAIAAETQGSGWFKRLIAAVFAKRRGRS